MDKLYYFFISISFILLLFVFIPQITIPVMDGTETGRIITNTTNTTINTTTTIQEIKESIATQDDSKYLTFIENRLNTFNINLITIEVRDERINGGTKSIILSYISDTKDVFDTEREIELILTSFFMVAEDGMDIDKLLIITSDSNNNAIGMYVCTKEWKESYISKNIFIPEVEQKVLNTFIEI